MAEEANILNVDGFRNKDARFSLQSGLSESVSSNGSHDEIRRLRNYSTSPKFPFKGKVELI